MSTCSSNGTSHIQLDRRSSSPPPLCPVDQMRGGGLARLVGYVCACSGGGVGDDALPPPIRLMSGKTDHRIRAMYDDSIRAIRRHLVRQGDVRVCDNCTFVGMWNYKTHHFQPQVAASPASRASARVVEPCWHCRSDGPSRVLHAWDACARRAWRRRC